MSSLTLYLIKNTSLSSFAEYLNSLLNTNEPSKNTEHNNYFKLYKIDQDTVLQAPDSLPQPLLASQIAKDLNTKVLVFGRESVTNSQYFAEFEQNNLVKYLIYTDFIQSFGNIRIKDIYLENIKNGLEYDQKPDFDPNKSSETDLHHNSLEYVAHFYNFDLQAPVPSEIITINTDNEIFSKFPPITHTWFQPSISSNIPY